MVVLFWGLVVGLGLVGLFLLWEPNPRFEPVAAEYECRPYKVKEGPVVGSDRVSELNPSLSGGASTAESGSGSGLPPPMSVRRGGRLLEQKHRPLKLREGPCEVGMVPV